MPKRHPKHELITYGLYTGWDPSTRHLPSIQRHTWVVPAMVGIEFGYVVTVSDVRGLPLRTRVDHPPFRDADGEIVPPFEDTTYLRDSSWTFFLGEAITTPVEEKCGVWTLSFWIDDKLMLSKPFTVLPADQVLQRV